MLKKFLAILFALPLYALADEVFEVDIIIRNHRFEPSEIEIPAANKIKITVYNMDDTIEEFESFDLKREKIVPPGGKINIILAPLMPGRYEFFGEFHPETATGFIIVK